MQKHFTISNSLIFGLKTVVRDRSLGKNMSLDAVKALSRENLEKNLTFISLLLFRNELKPDTRDAIENLREGEVRPVMITGDNAQCGYYIAKECSMATEHVDVLLAEINREGSVVWQSMTTKVPGSIDDALPTVDMWDVHQKRLEAGLTELAVTGKAFDELFRSGRMKDLLLFTRIYARCTPENKVQVINMHRDAGFVVGMCGDGGNDCGALRSAHVGLALSEAEASVVSPFTSKLKSVSSTVELVREGRAALHTSFASFKFLIMYGLSYSIFRMAQNWFGTVACQLDYIFIDGVSVLSLGYAMNLSNPVKKLRKERPTSSLLGPEQLASVLGMYLISLLFIIGELSFMSNQKDYVKWPASYSQGAAWWTLGDNWESTIIAFGIFSQFIASSVIFTFGSQFRRPVYRNYFLIFAWAAIFTAISLALLLPHSSFTHLWHVASEQFNQPNATSPVWKAYQEGGGAPSAAMSFSFRLRFWFLILGNIATNALWQKLVVDGPVAKYARKKLPNTQKLHL